MQFFIDKINFAQSNADCIMPFINLFVVYAIS